MAASLRPLDHIADLTIIEYDAADQMHLPMESISFFPDVTPVAACVRSSWRFPAVLLHYFCYRGINIRSFPDAVSPYPED